MGRLPARTNGMTRRPFPAVPRLARPATCYAALMACALASTPSWAGQTAPREHQGPVWGGREHAPTRDATRRLEDEIGVGPAPAQEAQDTRDVERLYRELTQAPADPEDTTPPPSRETRMRSR